MPIAGTSTEFQDMSAVPYYHSWDQPSWRLGTSGHIGHSGFPSTGGIQVLPHSTSGRRSQWQYTISKHNAVNGYAQRKEAEEAMKFAYRSGRNIKSKRHHKSSSKEWYGYECIPDGVWCDWKGALRLIGHRFGDELLEPPFFVRADEHRWFIFEHNICKEKHGHELIEEDDGIGRGLSVAVKNFIEECLADHDRMQC